MTREEFRDYVDFLRSQDEISYDVYSGLIDAIDTLEQEPKIVPIAVIKFDDDMLHEIVEEAVKNIEIEPKTGHWIAIDEEPHEDYECDKCGYVVSTFTENIEPHTEYKFCPNCGCRMVNPQESEEV